MSYYDETNPNDLTSDELNSESGFAFVNWEDEMNEMFMTGDGSLPLSDSTETVSLENLKVSVGDEICVENLTSYHTVTEVWQEDQMCNINYNGGTTTVKFCEITIINDVTVI